VRLERLAIAMVGAALAFAACADDDATIPPPPGAPGGAGAGGEPVEPPPYSEKATVKFKSRERLLADFQKSLSLDEDDACTEVGTYACGDVHGIALGGVDAYAAGIYQPLESSAVTTPIAVDRLALHLCMRRARKDLADPAHAAIYALDVADARIDPEAAASVAAIGELFHRVHLRDAKESEVKHLQDLYRDLEEAGSASPAADWATLSCYAVISMMESVYY
jgi:hypothetical protein